MILYLTEGNGLEKGLRSDFNSIAISKAVTLLIVLGNQSCLAWFLGAEGRGSYTCCMLYVTILSVVLFFSGDASLKYHIATNRINIKECYSYVVIYSIFVSLLSVVTGISLLLWFPSMTVKASMDSMVIAVMGLPFMCMNSVFVSMLVAMKDFKIVGLQLVLLSLTQLFLTIFLVRFCVLSYKGAVISYVISNGIGSFFAFGVLFRRYGFKIVKPTFQSIKSIVLYGLKCMVGKIGHHVNFQVGTIIVAFFATKYDLGLFAVAVMLVSKILIIPDTLSLIIMPRIAKNEMAAKEVACIARQSGIVCVVFLLIVCIFAEYIVSVFFSSQFIDCVGIIRIVSIGMVLRCVTQIFQPFFEAINKPEITSIGTFASFVTNVLFLIVLMPRLGLEGAALAMALSYLSSSIIYLYFFVKFSRISLKEIVLVRYDDFVNIKYYLCSIKSKLVLR